MKLDVKPAVANLVLPGAGLILLGDVWLGFVVGVLFLAGANLAIAATLLIPDEFTPTWRGLCIGLACGAYFGAQVRLTGAVRRHGRQQVDAHRRAVLQAAVTALEADAPEQALSEIEALGDARNRDLVVAYRYAQALTASGKVDRARTAWETVRKLDRHHLYRTFIRRAESELSDPS